MKYNSIGEQLIAKAKELDPSYKPDKFNDMSEAINIILNNSGSGKSVPPTLWLFSLDSEGNPSIKTTITQEEKDNLDNGLYNQVMYYPNTDGVYNTYTPSKLFSVSGDNIFTQFNVTFGSDSAAIKNASMYVLTIGEKDTSGNYPITIEKQFDIEVGSGSGGGGQSIEDLPVVVLTGDTTTITDEAIKAKILENINNNNYLICKLKLDLLAPVEVLITRDTKIPSNDTINDMMFTTIAYIDFGLVAGTISFMLLISSTDGTISAIYKMFDYVKGSQISLFQKVDGAFGVTTDYGDTNNINGLTFYFDTINGKPIIHRDTTVNNYNIPTIPTLPSDASSKTYALKAVNGVLTWVE